MADQDNTAEIEVSLVGDGPGGDAAAAMRDLADSTDKAAAAEDRYLKKLERRRRLLEDNRRIARQLHGEGLSSGRVGDLTDEQLAERRVREAERREETRRRLADRGFDERGRPLPTAADRRSRYVERLQELEQRRQWRQEAGFGPKEKVPLTVEQEAARRVNARAREAAVKARIAEFDGPKPRGGLAGLAEAAEGRLGLQQGALTGMAEKLTSMAGRFGQAAAVAFAAHTALRVADVAAEQAKRPYRNEFAEGREFLRLLPGMDRLLNYKDLLTGRSAELARMQRGDIEAGAALPFRIEQYRTGAGLRQQQRAAALNTLVPGTVPLPGLPGTARGTLKERHRYEEEMRQLPFREREAEARRGVLSGRNEMTAAREAVAAEEQRRGMLRLRAGNLDARLKGMDDGSPAYRALLGDKERLQQQITESERAGLGLREQLKQAGLGGAQAVYQQRLAENATRGDRLAYLQEREGVAANQAARLALMGPEGRLRGEQAMDFIKRFGVANAPQDVVAAAQAYAPETVRNMGEREGGRFVGRARELAPAEFRDDLPGIRADVDKLQREMREARDKADQELVDAIKQALEDGGQKGQELGKAIADTFDRMVKDAVRAAQEEGARKSFDQGR